MMLLEITLFFYFVNVDGTVVVVFDNIVVVFVFVIIFVLLFILPLILLL